MTWDTIVGRDADGRQVTLAEASEHITRCALCRVPTPDLGGPGGTWRLGVWHLDDGSHIVAGICPACAELGLELVTEMIRVVAR